MQLPLNQQLSAHGPTEDPLLALSMASMTKGTLLFDFQTGTIYPGAGTCSLFDIPYTDQLALSAFIGYLDTKDQQPFLDQLQGSAEQETPASLIL